jgi:regulator of sirC expression with transglutaminase-like and TPR domain
MSIAMPPPSPRARFTEIVRGPEASIDLAEAALLIAAEAYPGLEVARYTAVLDALAHGARPRVERATSDIERVRALIAHLAVEHRFIGNQEEYYDRRNSFLNEVLDRHTGIPITLTLVYTEVARRLGLPLHGVGFPGHFLAKYVSDPIVIVDPFHGQILTTADCEQRLRAVMGPDAQFDSSLLRAATAREILVRMLRNLKQIYLQAREYDAALACSERILLVTPDIAHELRDRGLLYAQLECYAAARADLERFLGMAPNDASAAAVRERLLELSRQATTLH